MRHDGCVGPHWAKVATITKARTKDANAEMPREAALSGRRLRPATLKSNTLSGALLQSKTKKSPAFDQRRAASSGGTDQRTRRAGEPTTHEEGGWQVHPPQPHKALTRVCGDLRDCIERTEGSTRTVTRYARTRPLLRTRSARRKIEIKRDKERKREAKHTTHTTTWQRVRSCLAVHRPHRHASKRREVDTEIPPQNPSGCAWRTSYMAVSQKSPCSCSRVTLLPGWSPLFSCASSRGKDFGKITEAPNFHCRCSVF